MKKVRIGTYQHFKGKYYRVIGVVHHSETLEELVLYRALYNSPAFGKEALWVRPKEMFFEDVDYQGRKVPRFLYIGKTLLHGKK